MRTKYFAALAALILCLSLSACGTEADTSAEAAPPPAAEAAPQSAAPPAEEADTAEQPVPAGTASPVSGETLANTMDGFAFGVPVGAQDEAYALVTLPDGSIAAQLSFTLDGRTVIARSLRESAARDLSGIADCFSHSAAASVYASTARVVWDEAGVITWYDGTANWCVYADSAADSRVLADLAGQLYAPWPEAAADAPAETPPAPEETPAYVPPEVPAAVQSSAAARTAADIAQTLEGTPYAWGGTGPDSFDNSGLVQYCFAQAGVTIPRTTAAMYAEGRSVEQDALEAGDVLFFSFDGGEPSYVGIYLGYDQFMAVNNENSPTAVRDFSGYYLENYVGARRFG